MIFEAEVIVDTSASRGSSSTENSPTVEIDQAESTHTAIAAEAFVS